MKLKQINCPICGQKNYRIVYKKNFKLSDFNTKIFSARRLPDKIHYQIVKCQKCGLVRSNPILDPKDLSQLYKKSLFTYNDEIENLTTTYINNLKPILKKLPKDAKVLEIGCGNGFVLKEIYKLGYKNVYGVEPSIDAVEKADKVVQKNIKVNILRADLFDSESFDLIYFFQTLDHIPQPNIFLKNCQKLLKNKGFIFAFNHNIDSFSSKILREKSPIIDIEHTFLYSPQTIKSIFEKNGFNVISVKTPSNILSLKHLFWLTPIPQKLKLIITKSKNKLLDKQIQIKLGNISIEAQKV